MRAKKQTALAQAESIVPATFEPEYCRRCGHRWVRRPGQKRNRVCPFGACKSPYWDVPPKPGKTAAARARHEERCQAVVCQLLTAWEEASR